MASLRQSVAAQDQQILAGGDGAGFAAEELQHLAVFGGGHGEFHLHGLDDASGSPAFTCWPASTSTFQMLPGT
jgi:hypothetical protein